MSSRRHFHTFDALRFFAFLKVFLLHLPITAFPVFNYLKSGGGIGVDFFFVLSGFLITYIILEEKSLTGKLNLRNFLIRRILRIWPLFYLMILVAFLTPYIISLAGLTSSNEGYQPNWLMSCLFLENYKMMFSHSEPNVSPLGVMWSLCVEEHFYIIWGVTLFFLPVKKVPILIVGALATGNITRAIYLHHSIGTADVFSNIDYFAWGAIPAFLLITRGEKFSAWIEKITYIVKIGVVMAVLGYVVVSSNIHYAFQYNIEPVIFGILFSSLLMVIIPEKNGIKILDANILSKLGIFTYGLYVYHTIVLNFLNQLARMVGLFARSSLECTAFFNCFAGDNCRGKRGVILFV
jgi:peptidoglycan/LPS O-acetylase OafA/YrhL